MTRPPSYSPPVHADSELEVRIERLVAGGQGLARLAPERFVILVDDVIAGERCRVRIVSVEKKWARAVPIEIQEPSPDRREPECPNQSACGGCSWMHIDLERQRKAKVSIVEECLSRSIGRDRLPVIDRLDGRGFGYRLRARFAIEDRRLGYRAARSNAFVPVHRCPILHPALESVLEDPPELPFERGELSAAVGERGERAFAMRPPTGEPSTSRRSRKSSPSPFARSGEESVSWTVAGKEQSFAPTEFFQANASLLEPFHKLALEGARGDWAWEFHAGVGFFTLGLAERFRLVDAVEFDEPSVRRAAANASGFENVQRHRNSAERWIADAGDGVPDFCLLDPPRRGARELCEELARRSVPRVHYVSCDPATLARDLVPFVREGYELSKVTVVDQFPHTPHVECVVHLVRGSRDETDPQRP